MLFVSESNMQWYRRGHNEHDWKSCCRQKRHEGSNPSHCAIWMKPAFRTFLSKSGLLHANKALRSQGFVLIPFLWVKVKTLKMWNEHFYAKSLFEHSFTINSSSTPPQMPVGSCILRSDGDAAHYRIGHIAPRFCGSFAPRCTLCGTPPLFWRKQKTLRRPRCHGAVL